MNREKESVPSRKQIAEYWKDKCISKSFEIIDHYEEGAEPVVSDWGEPECWACGKFNEKIYDNPKYDAAIEGKGVMRVWDFPESVYLQKFFIPSKVQGDKSKPSSYFLLCKKCYQKCLVFDDARLFYAYILSSRNSCSEQ